MPIGEIVDFFYRVEFQQECLFLLKEFNYLLNPLKCNVCTTYSQFPLINFARCLNSHALKSVIVQTRTQQIIIFLYTFS